MSGITVLHVGDVGSEPDGAASVRRFLNGATVGAKVVEGMAYELAPGARFAPPPEAASHHQLYYVTSGRVEALFLGDRHELLPGRGVYCEPGETCELENDGDERATFYRFLVMPS